MAKRVWSRVQYNTLGWYDRTMFDTICRFLAETFSTDFAVWLLGEPVALTELSPSELSLAIDQLPDQRMQNNIAASTAILSGLVLEEALIQQVLRRDLMQESVIYQSILQEEALILVRRQLNRKIGAMPAEVQAQIQALSRSQLEELGEALLDFETLTDLVNWLQARQSS